MKEQLTRIKEQTLAELSQVSNTSEIEALRILVLGKKGTLTQVLRSMGALSAEERPVMGKLVNELQQLLNDAMDEKQKALGQVEKDNKLIEEELDITIPGKKIPRGTQHPLHLVLKQIEDIFLGMGFSIAEGPEIEYDKYNFEMLNIPANHPARDMQDSFYITPNILLRTHTSPVQARTMLATKPPLRIICPGRVYRADEVDASHSPVFHQIEGLVVAKGVNMGDLKGVIDTFCKKLFGERTKTKFRPSYFPFTEPSAEVDVSCAVCGGEGCRTCKGTGWLEILGCGMVNPKVLKNCGIDPDVYNAYAFGMGLDRITMVKYGITDLRLLFENDIRFLEQFR